MKDERLKPCPFCGVVPEIAICDDEGNIHDEEYAKDPYSGLNYKIIHHIEQPGAEYCPIACHNDGFDEIGTHIYVSVAELLYVWNSRSDKTMDEVDRRQYEIALQKRVEADSKLAELRREIDVRAERLARAMVGEMCAKLLTPVRDQIRGLQKAVNENNKRVRKLCDNNK